MKSSCAVFTRKNPFPRNPPLPRSHYRPSLTQKLTKQQKKTTVSPARLSQPANAQPASAPPAPADLATSADQHSLALSNGLPLCAPSKDSDPNFCESWPSTDLDSPPANGTASPGTEVQGTVESSESQAFSAAQAPADQEDSVLAKYIERFRHGSPKSRMERRLLNTLNEGSSFWWKSACPAHPLDLGDSSIRKDDHIVTTLSPVGQSGQNSPDSSNSALYDLTDLSDSHCDTADQEVFQLQERASRLLQRSEHSISSSSLPVSSEGLSSKISSPASAEEPVRRPTVASFMDLTTNTKSPAVPAPGPPYKSSLKELSASRTRPEDDILFQWRLRRKMEQARQWPPIHKQDPAPHHPQGEYGLSSSDPVQTPHVTLVSGEPTLLQGNPTCTAAPSLPISSHTVSRLPQVTTVPPHMHLLCDVLPCPIWQSQLPVQRKSPRKPAQNPHQNREDSSDTSAEVEPSKDESSPFPMSTASTEEEWLSHSKKSVQDRKEVSQEVDLEKKQKHTVSSNSKKKLCRDGDRSEVHKRQPQIGKRLSRDHKREEMLPSRPQESRSQERRSDRSPKSRSAVRTGDQAPPPSPIHSALGQVVSEVLFPIADSPPHPVTPGSSGSLRSPSSTPPAPPQSPAPMPSITEHPEVVSQLLQEAEDSDGLEFEDDPLLQVLRQQREWVKEQISEADALLNDIQD